MTTNGGTKGVMGMKVTVAVVLVLLMAVIAAIQQCRLVSDADAGNGDGVGLLSGTNRVDSLDIVLLVIAALLVGSLLM